MGKNPNQQNLLRNEAEAHLVASPPLAMPTRPPEEILHELQVYQVELEMQNDELRRALVIIEESRDRYVDLYEFSPVGYLTLTSEGMIAEVNLSGAALLGVERKKLLNRRFSRFVSPEDSDHWYRYFINVLQHDWQRCELALKRGDGSVFHAWLDSKKSNVGNESSVRVSIIDITERKRMEQELRLKEFALNHASDAVYLIDQDLRFVYVNEEACSALGYSRDELLCLTPPDIDPDVTHEDGLRIREQTLAGGSFTFETRHRRRDGSLFPVEIRGSVFEYQGQIMNMALVRDISERKLLAQNEFFATILENALDAVVRMDSKGVITGWNGQAEKIFGWSRKEACGRLMHETIIPSRYREAHIRSMGHFLSTGEGAALNTRIEIIALHRDGHEFPVELSISPIKTADGYEFSSFIHDITERKRAEAALHESETYLRLLEQREIVQTSLDGFWVVRTDDARIIDVNDVFCEMVGYSREELLTMRITDLEANETHAETAVHIKKVMEVGYDRFETRHRHKQGHLVNLEVSVSHSELDGGILFVFVRNITERLQAEKNLRESESRFRTLFESATDCMLILDMDGRIIDINHTGYERLGYQEQEMLGRRIGEFDTPEFVALVPERMARIAKEGKATFEAAHVRKDGTVMPIEISSKIIYLDGEQRYFSVIRDITERKLAEQRVRELSAHLQTVREEEKSHLAREIHDDLGSALSALKIETQLLDSGLSAEQKKLPQFARVESMVELLDEAVKATRRIITDLRPSVLDDLGLMAALEWQAEQFHRHTGIECRAICIYKEDNGCIDCTDCEYTLDKALSINLFRIFQESLTNVARHSGASRVEAELQPCGHEVVLSISDNGCGLPEGHIIASTSYGIRGMRERVEQLGGKIEFDSRLGSGFSVMVKLPQPVGNKTGET